MTRVAGLRWLWSPASWGRVLFLIAIFLMVTGDWPRSTLLRGRWSVPLPFLAWPWLYLTFLAASFALLASSGALQTARPTAARLLHGPLTLLTATLLLSTALSQAPSLSEWAFGCALGVVAFTVVVARVVDDDTTTRATSMVLCLAASFLALRVVLWRLDEGLSTPAVHIANNAWLGKIQISWVLNLLAPLLLARFLGAQNTIAAAVYGVTWALCGAGIYMVFSKMGIVTFPVTTFAVCALNLRLWRRWLAPVAGIAMFAVALIAVTPVLSASVIDVLHRPGRNPALAERRSALQQTVRMIIDHPLVGIGFGTYDEIAHSQYGPIADPHFYRNGWHAHNTALHLLAETGILGILAWGYVWFAIVRFLIGRSWADDASGRLASSAGLGVVLAFFVLSMTEAVTAARLHASLRMNLTVALLVVYTLRLASCPPSAPVADPAAG
jgi:O-antigen ligase